MKNQFHYTRGFKPSSKYKVLCRPEYHISSIFRSRQRVISAHNQNKYKQKATAKATLCPTLSEVM